MGRVLGVVGGSAGVLSTIFAAGWAGVILIMATVVFVTGALCWVVNDADRPARLAMLLRACRPRAVRDPRRPPHQRR